MTESGKEELFAFVREHHLQIGEALFFECPHCRKEVVVEIKALQGDPDMIKVSWGKSQGHRR